MPEPHPIELRERVVKTYESGEGTYEEVAAWFRVGEASVRRWVKQYRDRGMVTPKPHGGGRAPEVGAFELTLLLMEMPDANAGELTAAYNRRRRSSERVHVSSMKRALYRAGYVVKKNESVRSNSFVSTSSRSGARI